MELKLRLLSEEEPLLKLRFSQNADFDPVAKQFEGGLDNLERIAARLATALQRRAVQVSPTLHTEFDEFSVTSKPQMAEGWWSKTFG